MEIRTHLGNAIEAIDSLKARYDKNVKELLADIQVLSRIVKHTVTEVESLSIQEIMDCIDRSSIRVGVVPVEPGLTNMGKVESIQTEDVLSSEDSDVKKHKLEDKYDMKMTTELEGRINGMCNLSDVVEERGMERGMERGIERGITALVEVLREMGTPSEDIVEKIMKKFSLTEEKAREFVK